MQWRGNMAALLVGDTKTESGAPRLIGEQDSMKWVCCPSTGSIYLVEKLVLKQTSEVKFLRVQQD